MCSHPLPEPTEEPRGLCPDALVAFATLYEERSAAVYRYFYHQVGHVQDAEDLTTATFIAALRRFAHYRPELASLSAWLFGVAYNCVRDYRRRSRPIEPLPFEIRDTRPPPEGQLLAAERAAALHTAIRQLSADQRDALALRYFGELRTSEVAAVLGKSDAAVKMLVHRAVMTLRDLLDQEGWR